MRTSPSGARIFGAKRELINRFLARKGYVVSGSQGAIYVWAKVPTPDTSRFFERLLEHGIIASPGETFGPGGEGYFRLALVPLLDQIERALQIWDAIVF